MKNHPNHFKSSKFSFALIGIIAVLFTYLSALGVLSFHPLVASSIVSLANIVVVFVGSITSIFLTGKSAVEWKQGTESHLLESGSESIQENIQVQRIERPRFYDDGSIN